MPEVVFVFGVNVDVGVGVGLFCSLFPLLDEREIGRLGAQFQLVFRVEQLDVVVVVVSVRDGISKLFGGFL